MKPPTLLAFAVAVFIWNMPQSLVAVPAPAVDAPIAPIHFKTDVMAVLSKAGCNVGGCHGNGSGKGGLTLSLRGQDPDLDWLALAREGGGRRLNLFDVENSLLLLKATAGIAHEGGKRFEVGSPEYALVRAWLADGALPPNPAQPRLTKLTVTPEEAVVLAPSESVQLTAIAKFSDGTQRDISRLAVYEANNHGVKISVDGLVTKTKDGESTVTVRYLDQQIPVRLAFVPDRPVLAAQGAPDQLQQLPYVDRHIFAKLQQLRIEASPVCDDRLYLRRAYLDLLGIPPTAAETQAFLNDIAPNKRAALVEVLLNREEFADFWALKYADLLKIEERALDKKGMTLFHAWVRKAIQEGMPLNRFAYELIAARGSTYDNPPANWWRANRDPITRAENTARIFLGTQLNCARCHNHPFERWTQDDYYGWAALFSRVDYKIVDNNRSDKNDKQEFKGDQIVLLKASGEVINPRNNEPAPPAFLGGVRPTRTDKDELLALADWLSQSPMFARMQVNRIWYHLLGRGLIDPVDDFRASNPPSHPALLDELTRDFVSHGYDLRYMIRTIMASRTYQLAPEPTATNGDDELNFSHGIVRRLSAEQILDSLCAVLDAPLKFGGYPDARRLAQVPEGRKHYHPITTHTDRFALAFGKPPRLIASDCERTNDTTLPQAFQLIGGPIITNAIAQENNRIAALDKDTGITLESAIDRLFWEILSREPTCDELEKMVSHARIAPTRRAAYEDIAWALINSKEFLFRH